MLIYLCFHLLGWQYPALFWGTDQLHYYPWPVGAAFVLVILASVLVGAKTPWVLRADQFLATRLCRLPFERGWFQALLLICFLLLAHTFRVRQHLLGDSSMWFQNLELSLSPTQRAAITWIHPLPLKGFEHIPAFEPLDFILHLQFFRLGQSLWGWTAQASYEWLSLLAGVAYLALLWKLVGLLSQNLTQRLTCFALLGTLGSIQLFFGYGESYTLVTMAAAAYLFTALCALRGSALRWPTLCLVLAVALHTIALSLLPSWIYLVWKKRGNPWKQQLENPRVYLPLTLAGGLVGFCLYSTLYPARLPLWTPDPKGQYALLSMPHLLQLVNALLLLSPFGLVWGLASRQKEEDDSFYHLLSWALLGSGGLFLLHDAFLGGRDWDLLSFPALFFTLWGIAALDRHPIPQHTWAQIRTVVLPLTALHTALWIGINASPERAIARLGNLLQYTNQAPHYQQFSLGYYYLTYRKDPRTAAGYFRQAGAILDADAPDYPQSRFRYDQYLAYCLAETHDYWGAVALFAKAYGSFKPRWDANDLTAYERWVSSLVQLGTEAKKDGRQAEADSLWKAAVSRAQEALNARSIPNLHNLQGIALKELGAYKAAIAAFQQGILQERAPKSLFRLYTNLAGVFQLTGDLKSTEASLAEAERINPSGEEFVKNLRKELLPPR